MLSDYPVLFELLFSGAVLAFAVREVIVTRRALRATKARAAAEAEQKAHQAQAAASDPQAAAERDAGER